MKKSALILLILAAGLAGFALPAAAHPIAWGYDMQPGASPVRAHMDDFMGMLNYIVAAICVIVLGLLIYVVIRFNARRNREPGKFAHNTTVEIIWTVVPIIILAIIAVPSMKLLYFGDKVAKPDMTVKVTGHQWYWSYEYPDLNNYGFDSRPIWDSSAATDQQAADVLKDAQPKWLIPTPEPLRLLETDNRLVLPVGANIRLLFAGADVIHSWLVPALGVQKATVPGRLSEGWVKIDREGLYYGQCTQICGTGHGYMPIVVEAVSPERYAAWAKANQPAGAGQPSDATPSTGNGAMPPAAAP